ncbi:MAG: transcriptional repressor [Sphaerochaetaceae bacterium]|nr:transcriptional repressor [Sphaerochaetaceae bacterium]
MNRRRTIQRDLVLAAVQKSCTHPTADEIFAAVVSEHPSISKATVYRNLNLLVEAGLVRRVPLPGTWPDHFDRTLGDHYHVYCECCGRVSDVDIPYQADLAEQIAESDGFDVHRHEIVFHGICPDCKKKTMREKSCKGENENGTERNED